MLEEIISALETTGGKLYYGGIAGAIITVILAVILAAAFSGGKRKIAKRINREINMKYEENEK